MKKACIALLLMAIPVLASQPSVEIHLTNRVMFTQRADAPSDHDTVQPYELIISPGTTVSWYVESGKHAIAADDHSFNSGLLVEGETYEHRFDTKGDYRFHDDFHLGGEQKALSGTIRVR